MTPRPLPILVCAALIASCATTARAHPSVQNAMDVVIHPDRVALEVRVTMEEVFLVERAPAAPPDKWSKLVDAHGDYVLGRLFVKVDGAQVYGKVLLSVPPTEGAAGLGAMASYRIEYPLARPPLRVQVDQSLLADVPPWTASFIGRFRQSTDKVFQSALLTADKSFEYVCEWPAATTAPTTAATTTSTTRATTAATTRPGTAAPPVATQPPPPTAIETRVDAGRTFGEYLAHGVAHITGAIRAGRWVWREAGLDHLLFAAALVLATTRLSELLKVVTAFTLAHSVTLAATVLCHRTLLGERIVEPLIAASIVFVAVQNVVWPRASRGHTRLALAFAFGLFHGLGFAGALMQAMGDMPPAGLGSALAGFSVGVEIGHQLIVLPLFALLYALRNYRAERVRETSYRWVLRLGSVAISVGGVYFLIDALRGHPAP